MAGKKRNWIQEERRQTLGDWVSFCLGCGHAQRFFVEEEALLPAVCNWCKGTMRHRCPSCEALVPTVFTVDCEECGASLRENALFGGPIRRADR
ncbi:MAG: hypothetical protein EXQ77_03120 [Thermoleophilia bacterium]|nr:hypothetical protein [Thermoleophilia bacterium]